MIYQGLIQPPQEYYASRKHSSSGVGHLDHGYVHLVSGLGAVGHLSTGWYSHV